MNNTNNTAQMVKTAAGMMIKDENIKVSIHKLDSRTWAVTTRYITKDISYVKSTYKTKAEAIEVAQLKLATYQDSAVYKAAPARI